MRYFILLPVLAVQLLCSNFLFGQNFYTYGGTIPNNSSGNCFSLQVAGVGNLQANQGLVRVCLSIDQARPNDMDISLVSPGGTTVSLSTDNGGSSGNDYRQGLCFSDCGPSGPINSGSNFRGVYSPENPISTFNNGASGDGTWTLCIDDDNASGTDGNLNFWSLDFGPSAPPSTPSGETCNNAFTLTNLPFSHTCMSLAGSISDYNSCTGRMGGADYLFSYTPTGTDEFLSIDIAQDYSAPSGFPTVVLLDTCPDLAFPANCIQTEIQMSSTENILWITSQPLIQGKTYYIVAASTSGTGGAYDIRISSGQNGNDDCVNATVINHSGEYAGNNYLATEPSIQSPGTAEMTCNGSIDNFVFYTFTTDAIGSTVYINVTDIDCDISCGGSCGIQLALFEEPSGGACQGPGTWGAPIYCESSTSSNQYYAWGGLNPNTKYYLMVDGNAGSKCVWNLHAQGDFDQTILSAEISSFQVSGQIHENQLQWDTRQEINVSHFEIEHSLRLPGFETIGIQNATGSSGEKQSYEFNHRNVEAGLHHYRIKTVDQNGAVSWSPIEKVLVEAGKGELLLFPNPAREKLNIQLESSPGATISVFNLLGKELKRVSLSNQAEIQSMELDLHWLSPGLYILQAKVPGQQPLVKYFTKEQ